MGRQDGAPCVTHMLLVTVWQMPKMKQILCHLTLDIPHTSDPEKPERHANVDTITQKWIVLDLGDSFLYILAVYLAHVCRRNDERR